MRLLANPSSLDDGGERAQARLWRAGWQDSISSLPTGERSATALDENCSECRNLAVNSWNVLQKKSEGLS
jgi:hypothetical protein